MNSVVKKKYQEYLEKKHKRKGEIGTTFFVTKDIVFESSSSKLFSFGVIGTGHVFDRWMHDLLLMPKESRIQVKGIFSNDHTTSIKKANQYHISKVYNSYDEMLGDPEIDAVYVATPNQLHHDNAIEALKAGKHVLCEKPIAVNTQELEEMYTVADENGCFLMEGMWMRTLPMIRTLIRVVESGKIGEVRLIETSCCNSDDPKVYPSMYNPERAGGALMDVGCYGLHFVQLFMDDCPELISSSLIHETKVDLASSVVLNNKKQMAIVSQSIGAEGGARASIHGTKGCIEVPLFLHPSFFTVIKQNGFKEHYKYSKTDKDYIGYAYEIVHFTECIRNGSNNSALIPKEDTLLISSQMEQIRKNSNIKLGSELL